MNIIGTSLYRITSFSYISFALQRKVTSSGRVRLIWHLWFLKSFSRPGERCPVEWIATLNRGCWRRGWRVHGEWVPQGSRLTDFQAELLAGRMQNVRGPRTGPIDFRESSGEREREREKASVIPSFPPFPSSSFREGSPRNLNIRHPSARSQPLPANCTFGIFRSPCIARSFSSRFEYADEIFHRGIIIAVLTCQIIFPARAESVKILKNLSYRERERERARERERERERRYSTILFLIKLDCLFTRYTFV